MSYEILTPCVKGRWSFILIYLYSASLDDEDYESFPDTWGTEAEAIQAAREYAHENDMD